MPSLLHINPGDLVAIPLDDPRTDKRCPPIDFEIVTIKRVTKTQLISGDVRIIRSHGAVIGRKFTHAIECSPQLANVTRTQQIMRKRYNMAMHRSRAVCQAIVSGILTVGQMEHIAEAYEEATKTIG